MTELLGQIVRTSPESATVSFERHYATDAADLWDAATSPDRLARWFAPVEGDLSPGGSFTIHFDDDDVPDCRVVACSAPTSFAWEWRHDGGTSLVEVEVSGDPGGSLLRLRHSRLTLPSAADYGAGWQAYVQALGAHLEGRQVGGWWEEFAEARAAYAAALG